MIVPWQDRKESLAKVTAPSLEACGQRVVADDVELGLKGQLGKALMQLNQANITSFLGDLGAESAQDGRGPSTKSSWNH